MQYGATTAPGTKASATGKLEFIEGLKGIGALQVIVLHYISAFFPVMARFDGVSRFGWDYWIASSPFFILYNGFAAFNLFFLMSGFVLAPSFAKISGGWLLQAIKRLFRLFVPLAVAFLIAVLLFLIFPHAKDKANDIAQSGWLAGSENNPMTFASLTKDLFLNSMVLGYGEKSWWASLNFMHPYLTSWSQSINGPFWTMHIILWGSLLLLFVAWLRRHLPSRIFYAAAAGILLITGTGGFSLFLIGYLLYDLFLFLQTHRFRGIVFVGLACLLIGLFLIGARDFPLLHPIYDAQNSVRQGPTTYLEWLNELGAVFIFAGVLMTAPVEKFLSLPVFSWLGRVSFSLYLTHFPILFTISCTLFATVYSLGLGYGASFLLMAATGISLSYVLAYVFERWVDAPCMALTKRLFPAQQAKNTSSVHSSCA